MANKYFIKFLYYKIFTKNHKEIKQILRSYYTEKYK